MEVLIERLNDQGMGICFVENKICFVDNCVIGDVVDIDIISRGSKFLTGKVRSYVKKSSNRVKSFCSFSDNCGGCSLCNMTYEDSIAFKKNKLERILNKFANIKTEVKMISSKNNLNYRNKITVHVVNGEYGYYYKETNKLVKISKCMIASDAINKFLAILDKYEFKNGEVVIRSNYNDELLINFIGKDKVKLVDSDLKIVGILQNGKVLSGDDSFIEVIDNDYFVVSYDSFFQINRYICKELFNLLNKYILRDKSVLDLYCGVGSLGLSVAHLEKKVYGIEIVKNAILNAIKNKEINKINNAEYLLGDVSKVIDKISDKIDVVLIDPPRSGLDKKTIDTILEMKPLQIIYISCDPITLARDLKLLRDYELEEVFGLDMFSYTFHLETFCVLRLR